MKLRSAIAFLLVSSAFGSSAAPAMADYVIFAFEGEITSVEDDDNLLGGAVTVGSPFSGSYTFDSLTPDSDPHPRRGLYWDAIIEISGDIAGIPFSGPVGERNSIEVQNDFASTTLDGYVVRPDVDLLGLDMDIIIALVDDTGAAFSTDHLPNSPPDLELFNTRHFALFDASESVPLRLYGNVTSLTLVPEPATLLMLGVAALMLSTGRAMRRRGGSADRGRQTAKVSRAPGLLPAFAAALHLSSVIPTFAIDCNDNGIDDAQELAACSDIEVVFVIDTSSSMDDPIVFVCGQIDDALARLVDYGLPVQSEVVSIEAGTNCICPSCESTLPNVHDRYGDEATGYPQVPHLGTCNPGTDGDEEDWAPATAIVAANKSWTEGGIRIIVPISDEGPRCGDPVSDPGADRDAIDAAIDGIHTFSSAAGESAVFVTYSGGQFVNTRNKEAE